MEMSRLRPIHTFNRLGDGPSILVKNIFQRVLGVFFGQVIFASDRLRDEIADNPDRMERKLWLSAVAASTKVVTRRVISTNLVSYWPSGLPAVPTPVFEELLPGLPRHLHTLIDAIEARAGLLIDAAPHRGKMACDFDRRRAVIQVPDGGPPRGNASVFHELST